ncbi:MAG: hypothetical protein KBA55_00545 [Ruminococcus sp.]|nr:hypothetical protein [Ruminococcus sp.]
MPDEKPSMYERTEYEIISETETENSITGVIRNICNGALIECRIPKHTAEEEELLASDITYALIQTSFTGQDISRIHDMEILRPDEKS